MTTREEAIEMLTLADFPCMENCPHSFDLECKNCGFYIAVQMGLEALKEKRPHGEWIIVDDCEHFIAKCSVCGRIEDSRMVKNYPFCRCGADMRKEGDENG